mgnify:FL=1
MRKELANLSHAAWMEFVNLYKRDPIGPSSTDYEAWLKTQPSLSCRLASAGKGFTQIAGYAIWRAAWLACEFQHGIRKAPNT